MDKQRAITGTRNNEGASVPAVRAAVGQWMLGGLAAASFAGVLTVVGAGIKGEAAATALRLFALAIPTLLFASAVTKDNPGRYSVGCLGRFVPVFGTFAAVGGIMAMLACADTGAAAIFIVACAGCVWLITSAEQRANKLRRRTGVATEGIEASRN